MASTTPSVEMPGRRVRSGSLRGLGATRPAPAARRGSLQVSHFAPTASPRPAGGGKPAAKPFRPVRERRRGDAKRRAKRDAPGAEAEALVSLGRVLELVTAKLRGQALAREMLVYLAFVSVVLFVVFRQRSVEATYELCVTRGRRRVLLGPF